MTDAPELRVEAEVQETLVRLWTCEADREQFLADRSAYLGRLPISEAARDRLRRLDSEQLGGFADSLVSKRLAQARDLLSDVASRMPDEFDTRFRSWAAAHPPVAARHHEEDAWLFGQTLLTGLISPELRDRLRWALLHLSLGRPGTRGGLMAFRHDMRSRGVAELPRRWTLVVWWKTPLGRGMRDLW